MKKRFLAAIIVGIMSLALVNAGIMLYYGQIKVTAEVTQPVQIFGSLNRKVSIMAGESTTAEAIIIDNNANYPISVSISTWSEEGIEIVHKIGYYYCSGGATWPSKVYEGDIEMVIPKKCNGKAGRIMLYPTYSFDPMLASGDYEIITTIDNVK